MSIDLKIHNSDLVRIDGRTLLADEKVELVQNVKNRLLTRQGEFFLDGDYGLDYEGIFPLTNKIVDKDIQRLTIRDCLTDDERISEVTNINITPVNNLREQRVSFEAHSIYGDLEEGVIIG